jgi:nucleoside diphosphate kinase
MVSRYALHPRQHSNKPGSNCLQRGLVGDIICRFEKRGYEEISILSVCIVIDMPRSFKLAAIKLVSPSKEHLEKHYEDLSEKPFFKGLVTCETVRLIDGNSVMLTIKYSHA